MPTLKIVVNPPKGIEADVKELTVPDWPVPMKGHTINLGPKGFTGVDVRVVDVKHWLGCDDIDIYCEIGLVSDSIQSFNSLSREDGWKW